jgi:hypothetical protein
MLYYALGPGASRKCADFGRGDRFKARVRVFRTERTGSILIGEDARKSLYWYRETMLRGYVRMQTEANGIELVGDKDPTVSRREVHVPSSRGEDTKRALKHAKPQPPARNRRCLTLSIACPSG